MLALPAWRRWRAGPSDLHCNLRNFRRCVCLSGNFPQSVQMASLTSSSNSATNSNHAQMRDRHRVTSSLTDDICNGRGSALSPMAASCAFLRSKAAVNGSEQLSVGPGRRAWGPVYKSVADSEHQPRPTDNCAADALRALHGTGQFFTTECATLARQGLCAFIHMLVQASSTPCVDEIDGGRKPSSYRCIAIRNRIAPVHGQSHCDQSRSPLALMPRDHFQPQSQYGNAGSSRSSISPTYGLPNWMSS